MADLSNEIAEHEKTPRHDLCYQAGARIVDILRLRNVTPFPAPDVTKSYWFSGMLADLVLASHATEDEKDQIIDVFRDVFVPPAANAAPQILYNIDLYSFVVGMCSREGLNRRQEVAKLLQDVTEDFVCAILDLFLLFNGRQIWPDHNHGASQRNFLTVTNISIANFMLAFGQSTVLQGGLVHRLDTKADEAGRPMDNAHLTRIELCVPYKRVEDEPRGAVIEKSVHVSILRSLRPIDRDSRIVYSLPADRILPARRSRLLRKAVELGCKLFLLVQDGLPRELDLHVLRKRYDDCVMALRDYEIGMRLNTGDPVEVLIIAAGSEFRVRREAVSAAAKDLQALSSYFDLCDELRNVRDALRQLR